MVQLNRRDSTVPVMTSAHELWRHLVTIHRAYRTTLVHMACRPDALPSKVGSELPFDRLPVIRDGAAVYWRASAETRSWFSGAGLRFPLFVRCVVQRPSCGGWRGCVFWGSLHARLLDLRQPFSPSPQQLVTDAQRVSQLWFNSECGRDHGV